MAARLNPAVDAEHRAKIQTTQLIKRLQSFALHQKDPQSDKFVEIDPTRLRAIEVLLRKALPDLSNIALTGDGNSGPVKAILEWVMASESETIPSDPSLQTSTTVPSDSPLALPTDEPGKQ